MNDRDSTHGEVIAAPPPEPITKEDVERLLLGALCAVPYLFGGLMLGLLGALALLFPVVAVWTFVR